jgi:polar amino acid transport system substrate-binding protein
LPEAYTTEEYAIAVSKKNGALLDKLNTALAELTEDGTIQRIIDKYISAD